MISGQQKLRWFENALVFVRAFGFMYTVQQNYMTENVLVNGNHGIRLFGNIYYIHTYTLNGFYLVIVKHFYIIHNTYHIYTTLCIYEQPYMV